MAGTTVLDAQFRPTLYSPSLQGSARLANRFPQLATRHYAAPEPSLQEVGNAENHLMDPTRNDTVFLLGRDENETC
jgi:hypothetical protein